MVQKDTRLIYENSAYGQFQHRTQRALTTAVAETDWQLHLPPLNIYSSAASPTEGKHGEDKPTTVTAGDTIKY